MSELKVKLNQSAENYSNQELPKPILSSLKEDVSSNAILVKNLEKRAYLLGAEKCHSLIMPEVEKLVAALESISQAIHSNKYKHDEAQQALAQGSQFVKGDAK
jgi:hypothetical protein